MTKQIILNLTIAMVWMLLHDAWNTLTFFVGYVLGIAFIFGMRRFFPEPFYGKKLWSITKLLYLFNSELLKSSIVVIGQVIRPRLSIQPGVFKVTTKLKTDWEIALLTGLLTLTPGSVVMEIAPSTGTMYIHAMDVTEFQESIVRTMNLFEDAILEVTS